MGECYAELGMTDVADNAGWQTCLFIPGFCNFVVGGKVDTSFGCKKPPQPGNKDKCA